MSIIQNSFTISNLPINQTSKPQKPQAEAGNFEALLASFNNQPASRAKSSSAASLLDIGGIQGFINDLLANINSPDSGESAIGAVSGQYPFSSQFAATFGLSGPLPSYINLVTAKLGLSAAQNQALQDISIRHKDAVNTPQTVQAIAKELTAAGIYTV